MIAIRLSLAVSVVLFLSSSIWMTEGCTVFIAGKDATVDGSVLVSHSNDGEFDTDPRLVKVPAADHAPGSSRKIYFSPESYPRYVGYDRGVEEYYPRKGQDEFEPIGSIPQVAHTFAYLEDTYGAVNEKQVGIGESTCSGIFGATHIGSKNGTALLSIDQLTQIAMERASSAREAVQLMGDLAVEYGFYGAGQFEGTAESLAVTDPLDAWIFHILPDPLGTSAIWVAQRVPADSFAVLANIFVIRQVDPHDKHNFLMSDSVHKVAMDYGWWDPHSDGLLDFTAIYSDGEYAHKFYSGRRIWGAYHLAAPSHNFPSDYVDLQSDPVYPVYTKPDRKLSQLDLFRFHRYYYQGTQFDLGAAGNLAAGPFGSPDRWKGGPNEQHLPGNWERAIGLYRTSDTYVVQSRSFARPDLGAILWFAPASSLGSVFTPFLVPFSHIPSSFRTGHQSHFDRNTAFWAACFLHNIANLKWSHAIQDIQALQTQLEEASVAMVQETDHHTIQTLETHYHNNAQHIVTSLWALSDQIVFKYASGFINQVPPNGRMSQTPGYPKWWLKQVKYDQGPPPPPTKPKCCHPKPATSITPPPPPLRKQQQKQTQRHTMESSQSSLKYLFEMQ